MITSGYKNGLVQLVGEAIHRAKLRKPNHKTVAMTICKWGCLKNIKKLIKPKKKKYWRLALIQLMNHEIDEGQILYCKKGIYVDINDDNYRQAGAIIVDTAAEIYATADLIVKVKEPQPGESKMCREGQVIFTYLHLAPDPLEQRRARVRAHRQHQQHQREAPHDPHGEPLPQVVESHQNPACTERYGPSWCFATDVTGARTLPMFK